jgi:hypothetical protein
MAKNKDTKKNTGKINPTKTDTKKGTKRLTKKQREEQQRTRIAKEQFIRVFSKGLGIVSAVCEKIGIDRSTYYDWMEKDDAFAETIRTITSQRNDYVEDKLMSKIAGNDGASIRFYLERRHGNYKNKSEVHQYNAEKTLEDLLDEEADNNNDAYDSDK